MALDSPVSLHYLKKECSERLPANNQMRYLLLVLGLLTTACGYGQQPAQAYVWTPNLQQAYTELNKGRLQPARQLLAAEAQTDNAEVPNGIRLFVENYADMLALLASDDDRLFAQLAPREAARLDALADLDDRSPYHRLLLAEVRLHWAFVKLKFGKEMAASWQIIKAYKLLAENQRRFPDFVPTYKSLGMLRVMIGSVPDSYVWATRVLGLRGDVQQGLADLRRAQQDPLMRTEARLMELLIRAYVLRFAPADEAALRRFVDETPDNLLVRFFAATTLMKNGQSEQALTWLHTRPSGAGYVTLPIIENLLGDIYLQKGTYPEALSHYERFLGTYRGQNFVKDTHYKRFLCYWLAGDDARARPELPRVLAAGRTTAEADKAAHQQAQTYLKAYPNARQRVLMQARLAADGGFLDKALDLLNPCTEATFQSVAERAEYQYRLGRIYQKKNKLAAAIGAFERAITLSDPEQLSFGATAALQLGYVYQQLGNVPKARAAFEKALSYKNHTYKNSVDNKARAALNAMR
jgi:tetratricopeptide (TPR) repeat protein